MKNNSDQSNQNKLQIIMEKLQALEQRIIRLESLSGLSPKSSKLVEQKKESISITDIPQESTAEASIESKVGEYGLAWLGSLVLLFGITFLMSYTFSRGFTTLSSLLGYGAAAGIFTLGYLLRKSFKHLVFMLNISAHLLIYYSTLRLHFFTSSPLITSLGLEVGLLLLVIGIQSFLAVKRDSEFIAGMAITLGVITAIVCDQTQFSLPLLLLNALLALSLFLKCSWWRILLLSLFLVYFTHLMWLLGNPLMGHPLRAVETHQNNLYFLISYFALYSLIALNRPHKKLSDNVFIPTLIWNGLGFAFLLFMVVLTFYEDNYVRLFSFLSALGIFYSILLKWRSNNHFDMAFYACFGFMALSVAVYGFTQIPDTYLWLALQSLLVVSLALWFRSKIITVVNTLLYLGILVIYFGSKSPESNISFTFALVALASARIMNWKKERLTLRTDMMRNMYLVAAFVTILYGLYHAVPKEYVTLSWTAAAAIYFLISILLKNFKYRWMAIATLLVTGFYLFLIDLARMEIGYRIVAFLFLAVISLGASLYYTKRIRKKK